MQTMHRFKCVARYISQSLQYTIEQSSFYSVMNESEILSDEINYLPIFLTWQKRQILYEQLLDWLNKTTHVGNYRYLTDEFISDWQFSWATNKYLIKINKPKHLPATEQFWELSKLVWRIK